MKIEIVDLQQGRGLFVQDFYYIVGEGTLREFRVSFDKGPADYVRRVLAVDRILAMAKAGAGVYFEAGAEEIEAHYIETGVAVARYETGAVAVAAKDCISVYLPVRDDFEDQETHWVGATPYLRELLGA